MVLSPAQLLIWRVIYNKMSIMDNLQTRGV